RRSTNRTNKGCTPAQSKWLRHGAESRSGGFDFPQIVRLHLYIQACSFTDGAIQCDRSLWEPNVTLFERNFLLRRGIFRVNTPFFGNRGRLCLCYGSLELGIGVSDQRIESFSPTRVDLATRSACQL